MEGGITMISKNIMETWADLYLKADSTYSNHVNKFINFIKSVDKGDKPTNITIEDVISCIGYYNNLGVINAEKSMESHLESIKAFYKFLVEKAYASDIFSTVSDFQQFKQQIISKFSLNEPVEREYLNNLVIKDILDKIDTYFENTSIEYLAGTNLRKRFFNYLCLRLFIKLTLLAPAKKGVICKLTKNSFENDFRILNINSVKINIPNGLRKDLKETITIISKEKNRIFNNDDNLFKFIDEYNFVNSDLNTWFFNFLEEFKIFDLTPDKDSYSVEVIMNTTIYNMVKNGTNPALIAKISGTSISSLENKYYKNKLYPIDSIDVLINNEISKVEYYNYL